MDFLAFFAEQGRMSDPGAYVSLFENLPRTIPELVKLVQGVTIHVFWTERYGVKASPERMSELQLRSMERRMGGMMALDSRPLTEPRTSEKKLLGNCRDHSLLLTAMLRHQGIAARARCGFATYFLPDHYEDHWVVEYWNQEQVRWMMVDAQLDDLQQDVLKVGFDTLDVPRDHFVVGGKAWQICRSGEDDPGKFGIFDLNGLDFVRGNLIRDVASLNKMELLPWDCWGCMLDANPDDLPMLDEIAELTACDVPAFETVRQHYETDLRLLMDGNLLSFVNGKMEPVRVGV